MEKKVVYSLLALSAVPAASQAAQAVNAVPANVGISSELNAQQDVQAYQIEADVPTQEELVALVNAIQPAIDEGVIEIDGYYTQGQEIKGASDEQQAEIDDLVEQLRLLKLDAATISQALESIALLTDEEENDAAKLAAKDELDNKTYETQLEEILNKARAIWNQLQSIEKFNELNELADEIQEGIDGLADDNNKKDDLQKALDDAKALYDQETAGEKYDEATEALENVKKDLQDAIDGYDAYIAVRDAAVEKNKELNEATDLLQKKIANKEEKAANGQTYNEVYGDLLQAAIEDIAQQKALLSGYNQENEDWYASDAEDKLAPADHQEKYIGDEGLITKLGYDVDALLEKIAAAEEAYVSADEVINGEEGLKAKLESATEDLPEDLFNNDEIQEKIQKINEGIMELEEIRDNGYAEHQSEYEDFADKADQVATAIEDLKGLIKEGKDNAEQNEAALAVISGLREQLQQAWKEIEDKKYGEAPVTDRYEDLKADLESQILELEDAAKEANDKGEAAEFMRTLDTTELAGAINAFDVNSYTENADSEEPSTTEEVYDAYDAYEAVTAAIQSVEGKLADLKAIEDQLDDRYNGNNQYEALNEQKEAKDNELAVALGKTGEEHWVAMQAISVEDIEALEALVDRAITAAQDKLDAQLLANAKEARDKVQIEVQKGLFGADLEQDGVDGLDGLFTDVEEALNKKGYEEVAENEIDKLKEELEEIRKEIYGATDDAGAPAGEDGLIPQYNKYKDYGNTIDDNKEAFDGLTKVNENIPVEEEKLNALLGKINDLQHKYDNMKEVQDMVAKAEFPTSEDIKNANGGIDDNAAYDFFNDKLTEIVEQFNKDYAELDYHDFTDEKKAEVEEAIENAVAQAQGVVDDTEANRDAYVAQLKGEDAETGHIPGKYDLQDLWNEVYTEIQNNEDYELTEKKEGLINDLKDIQGEINELAGNIEDYYDNGESDAKLKEVQDKIQELMAKIEEVKAKQSEGYDDEIAALNKEKYDDFKDALDKLNADFNTAIADITAFAKLNDPELKAVVDKIIDEYHDKFYTKEDGDEDADNDNAFRGLIQALTAEAWGSYFDNITKEEEASADEPWTVSKLWAEGDKYIGQANALDEEINTTLEDFLRDVVSAVQDFWNNKKKPELDGKVADAEALIAGYKDEAKLDAFKSVTDVIEDADEAAFDMNDYTIGEFDADTIGELDADLVKLQTIDADLAQLANAAADKDLEARIKEADAKRDEWVKTEAIAEQINELYGETVGEAKTMKAENADDLVAQHDAIQELIDKFINEGQTIKDEYDAEQERLKELKEAKDELAAEVADLIDLLDQLAIDRDENGEFVDQLTTANAEAQAAETIDDVDVDTEAIEAAAIEANQNYINSLKAGLEADYNQIASVKPEGEYQEAVDAGEAIAVHAKEVRDSIDAALAVAADKDATLQEVVDAEKDLAELITELTKELGDKSAFKTDGETVKDIEDQIEEIKKELAAELNNVSLEEDFAEDLAAINDAVKEAEDRLAKYQNHATFYEPKITAPLDGVLDEAKALVEEAQALDQLIQDNLDDLAAITASTVELKDYVDAQKTVVESYTDIPEDKLERYLDRFYNKEEGYYARLDQIVEFAKTLADENNLRDYITRLGYADVEEFVADKSEAFKAQVDRTVNRAANSEVRNVAKAVREKLAEANDFVNNPDNQFAASVKAKLNGEIADIAEELDNIKIDRLTFFDGGTLPAEVENLNDRLAEQKARVEELFATVKASTLGDANGDGKVTGSDYAKIIDIVLGREDAPEDISLIDINEDGEIGVADATAVANIIRFGNVRGEVAPSRSATSESMSVETTQEGNLIRYAINLNSTRRYVAGQMDIRLPEGMTLVGESLTSRANGQELLSNNLSDGMHRIVIAALEAEALQGNEGAVVYIDVQTDESYNGGNIELSNIVFADMMARQTRFTLGAEATGIAGVDAEQGIAERIYNMGGRVVNAVKKGINIIRRADGSTQKVLNK